MTVYIVFGSPVIGKNLVQILLALRKVCDLLGHSRSAEEAAGVIARHKPQIIIVEDMLLNGSGVDHWRRMASTPGYAPLVITVTTTATPDIPEELANWTHLSFRLPTDMAKLTVTLDDLSQETQRSK